MPANERRFWRAGCGHILGETKRVASGTGTARALMLYESSVEQEPAELPPLRGRVIGSMDAIRCTLCGRQRDWIIGEDALSGLIERVRKINHEIIQVSP